MNFIIISIAALVGLGVIAGIITLFSKKKEGEPDLIQPSSGDCSTCIGTDASCEQICSMKAITKKVEYYDDEELDRFIGRPSDSYSTDEASEFANILHSMPTEEIKGWNRSLALRGIHFPNQIKDELITMLNN